MAKPSDEKIAYFQDLVFDTGPRHALASASELEQCIIGLREGWLKLHQPTVELVGVVNAEGFVCCPNCGDDQIQEGGSHPCTWSHRFQEPEKKTIQVGPDFEWFDGDGWPECANCNATFALPEGWSFDYSS